MFPWRLGLLSGSVNRCAGAKSKNPACGRVCMAWAMTLLKIAVLRWADVLGRILGAVEQVLHNKGRLAISPAKNVGVIFERCDGAGVAEAGSDGDSVQVVCQEDRGVCMPEVVEANAFASVLISEPAPLF